ncbi:MAG: hypothetical protein QOH58_1367 [Thermoleophilaceae bacterium]|jgi:hypothetical protein|nr:hypothetical protein [Thermoleophilaceae bacterium]
MARMAAEPVTPLPVRASDLDRDLTERTLRDRAAQGHLSMETFAQRLERVHEARDREQLKDLVRDLPPQSRFVRLLAGAAAALSGLGREVQVAWSRPRVPRLELPPEQATVTLGRSRGSDYRLGDPSVSRVHAVLRRTQRGWVIEDGGSLNGTRLNGLRVVGPTPVRSGDVITLGCASLRIS